MFTSENFQNFKFSDVKMTKKMKFLVAHFVRCTGYKPRTAAFILSYRHTIIRQCDGKKADVLSFSEGKEFGTGKHMAWGQWGLVPTYFW